MVSDVRKVSGDLVLRWKNLIASPSTAAQNEEPKRVGSAKRKTPHPQSHSLDISARLTKKSKETNEPRKARLDAKRKPEDQNVASDARKSSVDGGPTSIEQRNEGEEVVGGLEDTQKAEPSRVAAVAQKSKNDSATTVESEAVAVKNESAKKTQSTSGTEKGEKSDKSSSPKASNKLSEFNMFEKLGQERREDKRPKRSRTYMAKFRSTGIEKIRPQRCEINEIFPNDGLFLKNIGHFRTLHFIFKYFSILKALIFPLLIFLPSFFPDEKLLAGVFFWRTVKSV